MDNHRSVVARIILIATRDIAYTITIGKKPIALYGLTGYVATPDTQVSKKKYSEEETSSPGSQPTRSRNSSASCLGTKYSLPALKKCATAQAVIRTGSYTTGRPIKSLFAAPIMNGAAFLFLIDFS
jgi:hypothetical protein